MKRSRCSRDFLPLLILALYSLGISRVRVRLDSNDDWHSHRSDCLLRHHVRLHRVRDLHDHHLAARCHCHAYYKVTKSLKMHLAYYILLLLSATVDYLKFS